MSRPIILSNGEMLVGLDQFGLVHDLYYPYIGQENHASARLSHHRVGVWVDGKFSWLDDGTWDIGLDYQDKSLVGVVTATNHKLQLQIKTQDFIDCEDSVFARRFSVHNKSKDQREVRIFLHQMFQISDSNRGGTAQFHPQDHMVVHYKGRRAFAMYAESGGTPFDQYSVGIFGIEGKEGTYRDAEDGELSGNPVEHGRVDSVVRIKLTLKAGATQPVDYWIAAARHPDAAIKLANDFRIDGFEDRHANTKKSWHGWLDSGLSKFNKVDTKRHDAVAKSLVLLKSHIDQRGGVLASADSDMLNYGRDYYGYCWPRDAVNALWPLIKLGYTEEASNFFEFCGRVKHKDGYLMHKYQLDGALGSSWHSYVYDGRPELPIQEDETAAVVFLVDQYQQYTDDEDYVREVFGALVRPAAEFMASYIDRQTKLPHASYDLWEERFGTHTYTVAITYAALQAASRMARQFGTAREARQWQKVADGIKKAAEALLYNEEKGYFYRRLLLTKNGTEYDDTVDIASLYGAVTYGLFDIGDPRVVTALKTATARLKVKTPTGWGVARYENDPYCRSNDSVTGNPWPITGLWLAKLNHAAGHDKAAEEIIDWTTGMMLPTGVLPEQIDARTNNHVSVAPLTWSQAEYVDTVLMVSGGAADQKLSRTSAPEASGIIRIPVRKV